MKRYLVVFILAFAFHSSGPVSAQENVVKSDTALAYLTVDIEKSPGWIAKIKGGYQWKLFRGVGIDLTGTGTGVRHSQERNYTKDGLTGSVSLGYNFARVPLTLGLQFGLGPGGTMSQKTRQGTDTVYSKQKVKIYALDLTADYDFRNCTRWTPFVGVTAGAAFVNQRGNASVTNAGGESSGSLDTRKRVNFMTGARAGVKYDLTERLTLSFYGSYNYLGKIPSKSYFVQGGAGSWNARTKEITAHSIDAKVALRFSF